MSTLLAHIKIVEGNEEKFEEISRELYEKTHDNEDSVIHYEYWRGREKGSYYTLLAYPSYLDFLITHQISEHHESAAGNYGDIIADLDLEWLDPVDGASKLGSTETQEVPDDAPELAKQYDKDHAVVMQDWWQALRKGS
ncbi:MAG: hypothetical protein VYB67_03870 [Pseudomonadota bacterium]|nr:hypothetical protein [Pseudomonadota bacterium]MEC9459077.1 hypothetical protein [Pseudomonadota bacterium]MED5436561.1 hypothetical protein [Pseudomonadota bacterium]